MSVHRFGSTSQSSFDKQYFDFKLEELRSKIQPNLDLNSLSREIIDTLDKQKIDVNIKSYIARTFSRSTTKP